MKLLLKLTILLICVGCTTTSRKPTLQQRVDQHLEEFFKDFPYASQTRMFVERSISPNLHGRCLPDANTSILNPYSIHQFTDGQLKYLVYHEAAHCALDLAHNLDTVIMGGSPFPLKFTIDAVMELRRYHTDMCQGKFKGVRQLAFGTKGKHGSCFRRAYAEDSD